MTAPSVSLLPCPFCNGTHISDRHVRDGRQMFCVGCGASVASTYHGPAGDTLERARTAWNTRATQSETKNEVSALHDSRVVSDPVRAGSDSRTDGRPRDAGTGDAASGRVAAVRDDGDSAGRARVTGLSATPPAPTPSAARERIARAAKVAHFGANTGQIIKPEAVPFAGYIDRDWLAVADAILALLPDVAAIRAAAFEEAAKIADGEYSDQNWHAMYRHAAGTIAAAIRAAGEK